MVQELDLEENAPGEETEPTELELENGEENAQVAKPVEEELESQAMVLASHNPKEDNASQKSLLMMDSARGARHTSEGERIVEGLKGQDRLFLARETSKQAGVEVDPNSPEFENAGDAFLAAYSRYRTASGQPLQEDAAETVGSVKEEASAALYAEKYGIENESVVDKQMGVVRKLEQLAEETEVVREEDGGFRWSFIPELFLSAVPLKQQISQAEAGSRATGENMELLSYVFGGESTAEVKNRMFSLSPEEQITVAKTFAEEMDKVGGVLGEFDGLEKWASLLEVGDMDDIESGVNASRWFENAIGALDTASIALGLKSWVGAGSRATRRALAKRAQQSATEMVKQPGVKSALLRGLNQDPVGVDDAAAMIDKAIETGDAGIRSLKLSEEDVVDASLPGAGKEEKAVDIPDPARAAEGKLDTGRHIERFVGTEDISELQADAIQTLNRTTGGRLHQNKSKIGDYDEIDESFNFTGIFGKNKKSGFDSLDEARTAARQMFGEDAEASVFSVKYKDPKTGKLLDPTKTKPTAGRPEYFIQLNQKLYVNPQEVRGFAADDWRRGFGAGWFKTVNSWFSSSVSKMDPELRKMATLSVDQENVVLEDFARRMVPYSQLKKKQRRRVDAALRQGEKEGKEYSDDELARIMVDGERLSPSEIEGYLAYRDYARESYQTINKSLKRKMQQQNMRWLYNRDTGFQYAARPVSKESARSAADRGSVRAYDAQQKKVVTLSRKDVDALYADGGSLAEGFRGRVEVGAHRVRYAVVDNKTRMYDLPEEVLKNEPGYIPRHYKANFFVTRQVRGLNTVDSEPRMRTYAAAKTKAEAQQYADEMFERLKERARKNNKEVPTENPYNVSPAAQLGVDRMGQLSDVFEMEGLMFYQKRARNAVKNLSSGDIIEEPYDALVGNAQAIASKLGTGRVIEVLEQKWMRTPMTTSDGTRTTWGEVFGQNGKFPDNRNVNFGLSKEGRRAKAMYDWIDLLKHEVTPNQQRYREGLWYISEAIEDMGQKIDRFARRRVAEGATSRAARAGYWLSQQEQYTPWAMLKSAAFTMQILTAPLRQAYIQSHQAMFLTGIDPTIQPRAFFADAFYLNATWLDKQRIINGQKWRRAISKTVKEAGDFVADEEEMANLAKNFENSGIPFLRSQIQLEDNPIFDAPGFRALGEVGYAAGERHNLASTYAFAYRKYLKDTGKEWKQLKRKDWDEINVMAREYALNMTRSDAFRYQRGVLSATTQYLSIRHKALQAFLGSDTFTGRQKLRMATAQTLMFGAEGMGLGFFGHQIINELGIEWPDENTKNLFYGGLYDMATNITLSQLTEDMMDEQWASRVGMSNIEFSKSMSAMGGTDLMFLGAVDFLMSTVGMGERPRVNLGKVVLGPGYSAGSTVGEVMDDLQTIFGSSDDIADMTSKQWMMASKQLLKLTSGGSAATRALAGKAIGMHIGSSGDPIAHAHVAELWAKGLLGFTSREESEFYLNSYVKENRDAAVSEWSDSIARLIKMQLVSEDSGQTNTASMLFNAIDDPELRARVADSVNRKLWEAKLKGSDEALEARFSLLEEQGKDRWTEIKNSALIQNNPQAKELIQEMEELNQEANERGPIEDGN